MCWPLVPTGNDDCRRPPQAIINQGVDMVIIRELVRHPVLPRSQRDATQVDDTGGWSSLWWRSSSDKTRHSRRATKEMASW